MNKGKKYALGMFLWSLIALIWFVMSVRYFYSGDIVGGILYVIVGIVWLVFGFINTSKNVKK